MTALVHLDGLAFAYGDGREALCDVLLRVDVGEHVAIVGPNGSGKSTLARIIAGLETPTRAITAEVCGHDVIDPQARRGARREVGILFQDPESQVVGATVEEDVAFGLENLGLPAPVIAERVAQMLGRFDLEELRLREPHRLSGGQKQRTALAGVLAVPRRLMVLDEPTAMLDAEGSADVLAAVRDLRADGLTVLSVTQEMGEVPAADRVVVLEAGQTVFDGRPHELFADSALLERLSLGAPVAAEIALELRRLGFPLSSLPLAVADLASALRGPLAAGVAASEGGPPAAAPQGRAAAPRVSSVPGMGAAPGIPGAPAREALGLDIECRGVAFSYESGATETPAVRDLDLALGPGTATALLGPSGAGKSTVLLLLRGLLAPDKGRVALDGVQPGGSGYPALQRRIGLVFQRAEAQLFAATAFDDTAFGPRQLGWEAAVVEEAVVEALEAVGLPREGFGERHPYSLSGGEQRRLALAGVLAMRPRALLLDEPTVSLDPGGRRDLMAVLRRLRDSGVTLVVASHDVDLAWGLCDRRLVLHHGEVTAAGRWGSVVEGGDPTDDAGMPPPSLVDLWRRLGLLAQSPSDAPRTAEDAAARLAVLLGVPRPAGG